MLRIHKLTPGKGNGANYYTSLASTDLASYYAGSGEAPGQWLGTGLEKLCLDLGIDPIQAGDIMTADGAKIFEYLNSKQATVDLFPAKRRAPTADGQWVSGYDFTFSAPKGLSMLAVMTDNDELRQAIYEAHEQAVRKTMEIIESYICYGREGRDGVRLVKGDGLIAAAFRHRTSRPGEDGDIPDPHLHTHVVVANIVHHPDGTYGALDGRALTARGNALALSAGAMFAAEQRRALEERGIFLEWKTAGKNGLLEVAGIPDDLLTAFSTRRNQIEAEMVRAGLTSYASSDTAQRKTRKAKDKEVAASSDTSLAEMLRAKMLETPITDHRHIRMASMDDLHGALLHAPPDHSYTTQEDLIKLSAQLLAPLETFKDDENGVPKEHLTAKHPTFTFWGLVGAISRSAPYAAAEDVMAVAEKILTTDKVIPLADTDPTSTLPWQQAYTTPEIITLENTVINMITAKKKTQYGKASEYLDTDGLSEEQTAMCNHLTGSGHQIDLIVGVAGSGKTYALSRCREAWTKADYKIFGCAKSASAANELEDGAKIRSYTIDKLLSIIRDSIVNTGEGLPKNSVVVVDEAGTVGTRELVKLAKYVDMADGKLVLVGDHRQLGAVDAGGLFGHLATSSPSNVVTLTENRRNQNNADTLAKLRENGKIEEVVSRWTDQGQLHIFDDHLDAIKTTEHAWNEDRKNGRKTFMLAYTRRDVEILNLLAHQTRVEAGEIEEGTQIGDLTISVGDHIVATQNRRRLSTGDSIFNNERGTVGAIKDKEIIMVKDDGTIKKIPKSYAERHISLGYAITIHKSQGMTVDTMHVLGSDQLYREAAYVAASRSRKDTHIYMALPTELPDIQADPEGTTHGNELTDDRTAKDRLVAILNKRATDIAASTLGIADTTREVQP